MKQIFIDAGIYISDAVYDSLDKCVTKGEITFSLVLDLLKTLDKKVLEPEDLLYYFGIETDFWSILDFAFTRPYTTFQEKVNRYGLEDFIEELERALTYYELSYSSYASKLNKVYLDKCIKWFHGLSSSRRKELSEYFLHSYFEDDAPLKTICCILRGEHGRA